MWFSFAEAFKLLMFRKSGNADHLLQRHSGGERRALCYGNALHLPQLLRKMLSHSFFTSLGGRLKQEDVNFTWQTLVCAEGHVKNNKLGGYKQKPDPYTELQRVELQHRLITGNWKKIYKYSVTPLRYCRSEDSWSHGVFGFVWE